MEQDQFQRELEEALELNPGEISADTVLEEIETFDSLGRLSVLAMIDTVFGFSIDSESLEHCKTVAELHSFLIKQASIMSCQG